jgi:hypothetical protein
VNRAAIDPMVARFSCLAINLGLAPYLNKRGALLN